MPKKKPPSYYKYQKENPTVSFPLTKDKKEILDRIRGDLSYGEAIEETYNREDRPLSERIQ